MSREVDRAQRAREERIREQPKEPVRPKPKEGDFDKLLERGRMTTQLGPQSQVQSKVATEQAIREIVKHEDRSRDDRERKDRERDEGRDGRQEGSLVHGRTADQKVVAKGRLKDGQQGFGGGGREGGFGEAAGRRAATRTLSRAGAKSLPVDLQARFAKGLAQAMKARGPEHTALSQQILNKLVQFVRIGINRKGEKEIQIELHERIFRGLKLRVIARGGNVGILFRTSDPKGRKTLEDNKEQLQDALAKKGIKIDEIMIS